MFLTKDDMSVIKIGWEEKGWTGSRIWQEHPSCNCSRKAIKTLSTKIKSTRSGDCLKSSGHPLTASTYANMKKCEEFIPPQGVEPGSHYLIPKIVFHLQVSKSTVHRMVKRQKPNSFK